MWSHVLRLISGWPPAAACGCQVERKPGSAMPDPERERIKLLIELREAKHFKVIAEDCRVVKLVKPGMRPAPRRGSFSVPATWSRPGQMPFSSSASSLAPGLFGLQCTLTGLNPFGSLKLPTPCR
mmetsp:Transcript_34584/g.95401  ORF Transcript_34584/g.95401 Transcript_34584/m.95401 type:complete len:125 (+) Transcript_34584:196-570(+)